MYPKLNEKVTDIVARRLPSQTARQKQGRVGDSRLQQLARNVLKFGEPSRPYRRVLGDVQRLNG